MKSKEKESRKYVPLIRLTNFNMDYDVDIKPIAKNKEHFNKWVGVYPFYSNVEREGASSLTQHNEKRT